MMCVCACARASVQALVCILCVRVCAGVSACWCGQVRRVVVCDVMYYVFDYLGNTNKESTGACVRACVSE